MRWVILATVQAIPVGPETGSNAPLARNVNNQKHPRTALLQEWAVDAGGADTQPLPAASPVLADPGAAIGAPGSVDPATDAVAAATEKTPPGLDIETVRGTLGIKKEIAAMKKAAQKAEPDPPPDEDAEDAEAERELNAAPLTGKLQELLAKGTDMADALSDPDVQAEIEKADLRDKKLQMKSLPNHRNPLPKGASGPDDPELPKLAPSPCRPEYIPDVVSNLAAYVCDADGPPSQEGWMHGVTLRPAPVPAEEGAAAAPVQGTVGVQPSAAGTASFAEIRVAGSGRAPPHGSGVEATDEAPFADLPSVETMAGMAFEDAEKLRIQKRGLLFVAPASPQDGVCHRYYGVREEDATEGLRGCKQEFKFQVKTEFKAFKKQQEGAAKLGVEMGVGELENIEFTPKPMYCPACKVFMDFYPEKIIPLVSLTCLPANAKDNHVVKFFKDIKGQISSIRGDSAAVEKTVKEETANAAFAESDLAFVDLGEGEAPPAPLKAGVTEEEKLIKDHRVAVADGRYVWEDAPDTEVPHNYAVQTCFSMRPLFGAILLLGMM